MLRMTLLVLITSMLLPAFCVSGARTDERYFRSDMSVLTAQADQDVLPDGEDIIEARPDTDDVVALCDTLTAAPSDPLRPARVPGVAFASIEVNEAQRACSAAARAAPDNPRIAFQNGRVFDRMKNYKYAFVWYSRSAKLGYPSAYNGLALLYFAGSGVSRDNYEGKRYLELAIEGNHTGAMVTLANLYRSSDYFPRDDRRALELLRRAAALGDAEARRLIDEAEIGGGYNDAPKTSSYAMLKGMDLPGGTVVTMHDVDASQCEAACSDDGRCIAYTYDRWNSVCSLKSSFQYRSVNARALSGYLPHRGTPIASSSPVKYEFFNEKAFLDKPFKTVLSVGNRAGCEQLCGQVGKCIAFTFLAKARNCKLFDFPDQYFKDRSAQSGAKRQN